MWENIGCGKILVNVVQFAKISLPILINTVRLLKALPSDLPKSTKPFASLVAIHQNFLSEVFPHAVVPKFWIVKH